MLQASVLSAITDALTEIIGDHGIYAVFILMFVDAVLPAASELVMVYAGAVAAGAFTGQSVVLFGEPIESEPWAYVVMATAGALGYILGSIAGWAIGYYGGRPYIERHGRWLHVTPHTLHRAEAWFDRFGDWAVAIGRVTPVVRSFIAIPAGVFRMPLGRYTLLTIPGSVVWAFAFAGAGWAAGSQWEDFHHSFRYAEYVVAAAIILLILGGIWRHRRSTCPSSGDAAPVRTREEQAGEGRWEGTYRCDTCPTEDAALRRLRSRSGLWGALPGEGLGLTAVPKIPLVDVQAQYAPLTEELRSRFEGVLGSAQFIRGPNVKAFEEEAAAYLSVGRAVGVANGTDALVLVLDAMGIGPGDEVICPAFTFYATAESIARRGATPVFADIDAATLNLDPEDVSSRITDRTKAIMPVHLFGRPAPLAELAALGVPLIEDAAQAFGAPGIAQTGVASTFSFYPTKNLFCLGDGGLVTANDEDLAERIRMLAFHGSRDKTTFDFVGYNSRLDELQAAFLRVFLEHLGEWTRGRREAAARYAELGLGDLVELPEDEPGHVYHLIVSRSPERDRIREALSAADISSATYYTTPLHLQPALRFLGYEPGSLPETERAAAENFSVPLWPGIAPEIQERVVETVRSAVGAPVS